MISARKLLGFIMLLCCSFLLVAFYLQHYQYVHPCPLCVLQRYAYVAIIIFCLIGRITSFVRLTALLSLIAAVGGAFAASSQIWSAKKMSLTCGKDALEVMLNNFFPAKWMPSLFKAEGSCGEVWNRIWGLSLPEWSLVWFMVFTFVFFIIVLRHGHKN